MCVFYTTHLPTLLSYYLILWLLFADRCCSSLGNARCLHSPSPQSHILNLGHGVLRTTPEENVAHMFDVVKQLTYDKL